MAKKIKTKAVAVAGDEELGRVAYNVFRNDTGSPIHWENLPTASKVGWMKVARAIVQADVKKLKRAFYVGWANGRDAVNDVYHGHARIAMNVDQAFKAFTSPRPSPHSAKTGTRRGSGAARGDARPTGKIVNRKS